MGANHKFIYRADTGAFIKICKKLREGTHKINRYCKVIITALPTAPHTALAKALCHHDVKWFSLLMERNHITYSNGVFKEDLKKSTTIAEIKLPTGSFIVMRNGNNIGHNNYIIIDCGKSAYYYRRKISWSLSLVDLLSMDRKQLPLLIGEDFSVQDQKIFEKRLKGE
jgi:hypothetical protein